MSGGTFNHNRIGLNVAFLLNLFFDQENKQIEAFSSDMKVYSEALDRSFYPDVSVVIGEPQQVNSKSASIFTNPVLLVEVLSKSTRDYDMTKKFGHYRSIPAFSEYVIIEQDRFFVEVRTLADKERGLWDIQQYENVDDEVYLQSVGCRVKLGDIYKRVKFEEE
jgi:Uma2 family endonuclease